MFMNNLADFALALKFHTMANRPISIAEFQRAVKISSGFELDPQIVQVIFAVFDQDGDGQLSYKEFIAVLKDRLRRGQKVNTKTAFPNPIYLTAFIWARLLALHHSTQSHATAHFVPFYYLFSLTNATWTLLFQEKQKIFWPNRTVLRQQREFSWSTSRIRRIRVVFSAVEKMFEINLSQ